MVPPDPSALPALLSPLVAKPLLVIHGLAAIVTAGASAHMGWLALRALATGRSWPRLHRLYPRILAWAYPITMLLGLVIYPRFRVHVRFAWLDQQWPLATGLFEIKEHWLALGLGLLLFYLVPRARTLDFKAGAPDLKPFHVAAIAVAVAVLASTVWGMALVALRPI